ncbi:MAG: flavin reductase family protein [Bacilli bacterium]|nr:flavin reductase family protein [Bacilli bacterium]
MRKDFGAKPLSYPQPVFIIAAYDENGAPCAMNAAWGGISEENQLSICLSAFHKTVKNILLTKEYTVSMGTAKEVVACDYVGITSGNAEAKKMEKTGWHLEKAKYVNAPYIDELPIALELKLIDYNKETCIMRGEIVNVAVKEEVLDENGNVDVNKVGPIVFDPFNNEYVRLGEKVGKAFNAGMALKK